MGSRAPPASAARPADREPERDLVDARLRRPRPETADERRTRVLGRARPRGTRPARSGRSAPPARASRRSAPASAARAGRAVRACGGRVRGSAGRPSRCASSAVSSPPTKVSGLSSRRHRTRPGSLPRRSRTARSEAREHAAGRRDDDLSRADGLRGQPVRRRGRGAGAASAGPGPWRSSARPRRR